MSDALPIEVINEIIFAMENQGKSFVYDTEEGVIVQTSDAASPSSRYLALPEWTSIMGFHLMERFVSSLRNPLFRDVLRESLASGHGVFRKFKNALKERPEMERLWFGYKEREMRGIVSEWFNEYRESIGLGRVAIDEEDTSELVLSDFRVGLPIDPSDGFLDELAELDREAFEEMYPEYGREIVDLIFARARSGAKPGIEDVLVAESPDGLLAGFLWFEESLTPDGSRISWIRQLMVVPDFRGLGIAKALLEYFVMQGVHKELSRVFLELGSEVRDFGRILLASGFEETSRLYSLDVVSWASENPFA